VYVECTYCHELSWFEAAPANGVYRCLRCDRLFLCARAHDDVPTGQPAPERPRLTDRHLCHQCGAAIDVPDGLRRCTVTCPACEGRTSAYAVVYRCLACGRLLASPSAKEGKTTTCPSCGEWVEVPCDCLFREDEEPVDDRWFAFECVHCAGRVETMKTTVGQLGVCPHCQRPVRVPKWGYLADEAPRTAADPLVALGDSTTRHCPHCGLPKPTRAAVCPACGE